jgi:hypothetical protein
MWRPYCTARATVRALDWLETAARIRDPGLGQAGTDALLDPLRNQPRFKKVLESAGL